MRIYIGRPPLRAFVTDDSISVYAYVRGTWTRTGSPSTDTASEIIVTGDCIKKTLVIPRSPSSEHRTLTALALKQTNFYDPSAMVFDGIPSGIAENGITMDVYVAKDSRIRAALARARQEHLIPIRCIPRNALNADLSVDEAVRLIDSVPVNLLPADVRIEAASRNRTRHISMAATLTAIIAGITAAVFVALCALTANDIRALREQQKIIRPLAMKNERSFAEYSKALDRETAYAKRILSATASSYLFETIAAHTAGCLVEQMEITHAAKNEYRFSLRAGAATGDAVNRVVRMLASNRSMHDVKLTSMETGTGTGGSIGFSVRGTMIIAETLP